MHENSMNFCPPNSTILKNSPGAAHIRDPPTCKDQVVFTVPVLAFIVMHKEALLWLMMAVGDTQILGSCLLVVDHTLQPTHQRERYVKRH